MYKTCLNCKRPLGENEVVEHFPSAAGSPSMPRRDASGSCAGSAGAGTCRRSRSAGRRSRTASASTGTRASGHRPRTSGIARLSEGLELVRIGKPLRPEFAAWRYGDQLGERMRRMIAGSVVGFPTGVALYQVLTPWGLTLVPVALAALFWLHRRPVAKVRVGDAPRGAAASPDNVARIRSDELSTFRVLPDGRDPGFRVEIRQGDRTARFEGEDARASPERSFPW